MGWYDRTTRRVRDLPSGDMRVYLEFEVRRVLCRRCGKVKREQLDFLADNPFYTKRIAWYVGRRCRASTIKDVAEELLLDSPPYESNSQSTPTPFTCMAEARIGNRSM